MGDGIHNEDLHTLDAGLMGESGISSWPAVVVFRDAIIHAHGDIQTQVTFPAASEEFESGIKLAQLCVASFLTGPTRLVGALRFMSRGLVVMFPFSQVVTHRNFLARNYLGVRKCILHPQFFLSRTPPSLSNVTSSFAGIHVGDSWMWFHTKERNCIQFHGAKPRHRDINRAVLGLRILPLCS